MTLGLGLINFNAVVDSIFASRLIDPELAPTAIDKAFRLYMLPQGIFSVAITTVLFPSLSRLAARGDQAGFRNTRRARAAADRVPAHPGERRQRRARRADHAARLPARRSSSRRRRRSSPARSPRSRRACFFNGVMLLLNRGVLQPAVELDPDGRRAREPRPERRARRGLLPLRHVGDSARDVARQRRRQRGRCSCCCAAGSAASSFGARCSTRSLRIVVASAVLAGAAYGVWYGLDSALGRVVPRASSSRSCAALVAGTASTCLPAGAQGSRARGVASVAQPLSKRA